MKSQNCCSATFKIESLHNELIIARGQLNPVPLNPVKEKNTGES